jgi:hypothetical protein
MFRTKLLGSWMVLAAAGVLASPAAAGDTDIAISTPAIDFGVVGIGQTSQVTVTLTNTGGDPFVVHMFGGAPPTPEFNAAQTCQLRALPAGGSCTLTYSFSPGSSGVFNDTSSFTVSESDSQDDGEDFDVSLTGRTPSLPSPCGLVRICDPIDIPTFEIPAEQPGEEPPAEEPPDPTFALSLDGTARVKAGAFKSRATYLLELNVDTEALTFSAMDGAGTLYGGHLAPKNAARTKFALFLDSASEDAFAADVTARGTAAAGPATPAILGSDAQIVFKHKADGSASLRIKSTVLVEGTGEVTFKANLISR